MTPEPLVIGVVTTRARRDKFGTFKRCYGSPCLMHLEEYPRIFITNKRIRSGIGASIEDEGRALVHKTMNSWPSLLGTSHCIMWLLVLTQAELALEAAARDGLLPREYAHQAKVALASPGKLFEGYRLAILAATQILENCLLSVDEYGIGEKDKTHIRKLVNNVKTRNKNFRRDLITTTDPTQLYTLVDAYGQSVQQDVEELCLKLLVNEQRKSVESLLTLGIPGVSSADSNWVTRTPTKSPYRF